jgi:putative transposase
MTRLARAVAVGFPYHVTHRGNRRQDIFFSDDERRTYLDWLREYSRASGLEIWAWCLMSNHVHLLVVPAREDALARAIGLTHRRHALALNAAHRWTGHLWEHRFFSTALDESHLWAAVRYIEQNPVRAGLVGRAEKWCWSSARCHALGESDALLAAGRPFPAPGDRRRLGDMAE